MIWNASSLPILALGVGREWCTDAVAAFIASSETLHSRSKYGWLRSKTRPAQTNTQAGTQKMEGLFPQTHQWMAQILKGYSKTTKKRLQYTLAQEAANVGCSGFNLTQPGVRTEVPRGTIRKWKLVNNKRYARWVDGWLTETEGEKTRITFSACFRSHCAFFSLSLSFASNPTEQIKSNSERAHVSVLWSNWILFEIRKSITATHLMHATAWQPGCITELHLMVFRKMWKAKKESTSLKENWEYYCTFLSNLTCF